MDQPNRHAETIRRGFYAVLGGTTSSNLGLGLLRPVLPLYLRAVFQATSQQVTWIPLVFGLGKLLADLPTGISMDRIGRRRLLVGAYCGIS